MKFSRVFVCCCCGCEKKIKCNASAPEIFHLQPHSNQMWENKSKTFIRKTKKRCFEIVWQSKENWTQHESMCESVKAYSVWVTLSVDGGNLTPLSSIYVLKTRKLFQYLIHKKCVWCQFHKPIYHRSFRTVKTVHQSFSGGVDFFPNKKKNATDYTKNEVDIQLSGMSLANAQQQIFFLSYNKQ